MKWKITRTSKQRFYLKKSLQNALMKTLLKLLGRISGQKLQEWGLISLVLTQEKKEPINDLNEVINHLKTMEKEEPYFDEKGTEIKEFAVIRVFHFIGARRKRYYMYKWVRLKEFNGKLYWIAMHLTNDKETSWYNLRAAADKETRIIKGTLIVQQY